MKKSLFKKKLEIPQSFYLYLYINDNKLYKKCVYGVKYHFILHKIDVGFFDLIIDSVNNNWEIFISKNNRYKKIKLNDIEIIKLKNNDIITLETYDFIFTN